MAPTYNCETIMRITRRKIEQAILDLYGLDVVVVRGNGYYYFASDDDDSCEVIYRLPTTSVYTMQLNGGRITLDWWVDVFEQFLIDGDFIEKGKYNRSAL